MPTSSASWVPKLVERLRQLPQLADVASDLQDGGLQAYVDIDRETASRLGVTPAAIDNALYNAFGQRLVSTIFTQTNQYRVVLEVQPEFQQGPAALDDIYVSAVGRAQPRRRAAAPDRAYRVRDAPAAAGAAAAVAQIVERAGAARRQPRRPVSGGDDLVQPRARRVARRRGRRDRGRASASSACRVSVQLSFQGAALAFRASLANTLLLILAAIVTMYIVLGVLYESYIHPITILSTLPSAGVGALLALMLAGNDLGDHRDHRHHPADRHRQEERDHDDRLRARRRAQAKARRRARRSTRPACCASGRS